MSPILRHLVESVKQVWTGNHCAFVPSSALLTEMSCEYAPA